MGTGGSGVTSVVKMAGEPNRPVLLGGARTSGTGVRPGTARETQAVKVVRAAESPRGQDTRLGWEVLGNL